MEANYCKSDPLSTYGLPGESQITGVALTLIQTSGCSAVNMHEKGKVKEGEM